MEYEELFKVTTRRRVENSWKSMVALLKYHTNDELQELGLDEETLNMYREKMDFNRL